MVFAKAILDIAGEYSVFNQQLLERDILQRLEELVPAEVKTILQDAMQRARSLEPINKVVKHFTGSRPAELQLDVPGKLIEAAVPEVREKREREPAPKIDIANTNYFERPLRQVPTVLSSGPSNPVRKADPIPGPSREDQLARINRMSPKDLADYVYHNPHQLLKLTAALSQAPTGPAALYEVKDGTKIICVLDRSDYRLLLGTVQQAVQAIAAQAPLKGPL